jgi:hypothetical protein
MGPSRCDPRPEGWRVHPGWTRVRAEARPPNGTRSATHGSNPAACGQPLDPPALRLLPFPRREIPPDRLPRVRDTARNSASVSSIYASDLGFSRSMRSTLTERSEVPVKFRATCTTCGQTCGP